MTAARRLEAPRIRNVRSNRNAAQRRRERATRSRYVGLRRFCGVLAIVVTAVMLYVMLVSRLTGMSYAVAKLERQRAVLEVQTARMEDELAALRSDDRLAQIAAALRMRDPSQFAIVALPAPVRRTQTPHVAFLSTLTTLFGPR